MNSISEYLCWYKNIENSLNSLPRAHILMSSSVEEPLDLLLNQMQKYQGKLNSLLRTPNPWGLAEIYDCLSLRYGVPKDMILPAAGTSNALYLVCRSLLGPGDEVVVECPYYEPLITVPKLVGANIRLFHRPPPDYEIDLDWLKKALTKKTKLIIATNLHNPSGSKLEDDELIAISDLAAKHNKRIKILVDEIYHDFIIDSQAPAVKLGPEFISISSLTKVYGLGFLRCGWIFADKLTIEKIRQLQVSVEGIGSRILEAISIMVLENLEQYAARSREIIGENREILRSELDGLIETGVLQGDIPENGCIYFPKIADTRNTDLLCKKLIDEFGIYVVPGRFFGAPEHVRIGFGSAPLKFREAIGKLKKYLPRLL